MTEMIQNHKFSKNLMTFFTVSTLMFLVLMYFCSIVSENYQGFFYTLIQITFIVMIFSGTGGIWKSYVSYKEKEADVLSKLKDNKAVRVVKKGYNLFQVSEIRKEIPFELGTFKIDLNSIPSTQIEIDYNKKIIFYK